MSKKATPVLKVMDALNKLNAKLKEKNNIRKNKNTKKKTVKDSKETKSEKKETSCEKKIVKDEKKVETPKKIVKDSTKETKSEKKIKDEKEVEIPSKVDVFNSDFVITRLILAHKVSIEKRKESKKIVTKSDKYKKFFEEAKDSVFKEEEVISKSNLKSSIQKFMKKEENVFPIVCVVKKILHANSELRKGKGYDLIVGEDKGDYTFRIYLGSQLSFLIKEKILKKEMKISIENGGMTKVKDTVVLIPTKITTKNSTKSSTKK